MSERRVEGEHAWGSVSRVKFSLVVQFAASRPNSDSCQTSKDSMLFSWMMKLVSTSLGFY